MGNCSDKGSMPNTKKLEELQQFGFVGPCKQIQFKQSGGVSSGRYETILFGASLSQTVDVFQKQLG